MVLTKVYGRKTKKEQTAIFPDGSEGIVFVDSYSGTIEGWKHPLLENLPCKNTQVEKTLSWESVQSTEEIFLPWYHYRENPDNMTYDVILRENAEEIKTVISSFIKNVEDNNKKLRKEQFESRQNISLTPSSN